MRKSHRVNEAIQKTQNYVKNRRYLNAGENEIIYKQNSPFIYNN